MDVYRLIAGLSALFGIFAILLYSIINFKKLKLMKTLLNKIITFVTGASKTDLTALLGYFQAIVAAVANGAGISSIKPPVTSSPFINTLDQVLEVILEFLPIEDFIPGFTSIISTIEGLLNEAEDVLVTIQVKSSVAKSMVASGNGTIVTLNGNPALVLNSKIETSNKV